jgi:N utilization substance protein A
MVTSPFSEAINHICEEKGLERAIVVDAVEAALAAAYRKDYGSPHWVVRSTLNETDITKTTMRRIYAVVKKDELEDEDQQLPLAEARKLKPGVKVGEEVEVELPVHADFGRIAAQTAKQVIIQRLQEAERTMLYTEYKSHEGQLLNGTIQQVEGRDVVVNLGKINAIMPQAEQVRQEHYYGGQRVKVYVVGVEETSRGPRVIVSRAHPQFIAQLFELEVPEIQSGTVTIEGIAREAGSRTKLAVAAHQDGLDPVGSCVGQRGIRVQAVLAELGDEKIDIILHDPNRERFIANALSPASVDRIEIDAPSGRARVFVPNDQLSLAIGKGGQNVRLAGKLVGLNLDIERTHGEPVADEPAPEPERPASGPPSPKRPKKRRTTATPA